MTCTATLGPLACTLPANHPHGHVFESTSGDVRGQQKPDGGEDE